MSLEGQRRAVGQLQQAQLAGLQPMHRGDLRGLGVVTHVAIHLAV